MPAANAEQVGHGDVQALLGQHRVHAGLEPRAQRDQLGPVADHLAKLPHSRRRQVGLRQPTHPQQVRQIRRVAHVVLDPPVGETLYSQRMRQMDLRTGGLQHISRPVPAIRRFQHHLRIPTSLRDLQAQRDRVIVDAYRRKPLTGLGHPHDHAAAPVQIDTHDLPTVVLCLHVGPPST